MSSKEREEFYTWYNDVSRTNIFNFKEELIAYCKQDVVVLRLACLKFREIFIKCVKLCPFTESVTLAGSCSLAYRRNFLSEKFIGVIPQGGYVRADIQSEKAIKWLLWMELQVGCEIVHAGRAREYTLFGRIKVDGFLPNLENQMTGSVFQFHGCLFHGCPVCYPTRRDQPLMDSTSLNVRYENTIRISNRIRANGYELIEMWEHDFDQNLATMDEFKNYIANQPLAEKIVLQPRDAFYGGRTGNIATMYRVKNNEKIKYIDVCSLYPYVCKSGKFPIGHPTIYSGKNCLNITGQNFEYFNDRVEGLVKCTILPPTNLFHPVLPYRQHDKLLFPLCRTCAETLNPNICTHTSVEERALSGTWVSDEIKKSLQLGYKLVNIEAIWQYEVTQYQPNAPTQTEKTRGMFTDYINLFLKLKAEASGWPIHCNDEASENTYLREYYEREGIMLEREKIAKNPGMRSVAKLALNSLWGKFGQRGNLPVTEVVNCVEQLLRLITDPEKEVGRIIVASEDVLYVSWRYKNDLSTSALNSNVVVAAYTSAQGRLTLYEYLYKLDERVLYYDTDSIIYVSKGDPNEYEPETGCMLGQMTNELEEYGAGAFIETFCSGGPKFYAYRVRNVEGQTFDTCKAKGFRLNYENSMKINFESVLKLLETHQFDPDAIYVEQIELPTDASIEGDNRQYYISVKNQ